MDDIVIQELINTASTETERDRESQASSESVGGSSATLPNSQIVYDQEERYVQHLRDFFFMFKIRFVFF